MAGTPNLLLAFVAGFVSFVSPCCLPLVPGYLAAVSGGAPGGSQRVRLDPRMLARSGLFVATFSAIFILFGLAATAIGSFLIGNKTTLNHVAGLAIIAMGALFIASLFVTRLNRDFRPHGLIERAGRGGPVIAGAAFAVAWTPCVGPTLGAILGLAATTTGTAHAGLLLAVYSAGLAVPFLLSAVAFNAATRGFAFFKRHYVVIQLASGIVLIAMGYLVLSDRLFQLNIDAQHYLGQLGLNFFHSI